MKDHFIKTGKMMLGGTMPILIGLNMLVRSVVFLFTGKLGVDVDINYTGEPGMKFNTNEQ